MSVVLTFEQIGCHDADSRCNICGCMLVPPFMQCCGINGAALFVCGPCGHQKRAGIVADLTQLAAKRDYPDKVLVRRDLIEAEERQRWLSARGVVELFPRDPEDAA